MFTHYQPTRFAALALMLGTLALTAPSFAADSSAAATSGKEHMHKHHHMNPEEMRKEVEERISTLHTKLNITPDQESEWNDVANAMRDSEKNMMGLMHDRHERGETRTAVEDLQSYQKVAQTHADGLQKVTDAFSTLYGDMSDAQKANADTVFGSFEGHDHHGHDGMKPASATAPAMRPTTTPIMH